jgi:multiple sugar transport system substrate-binding protein
MPTAVRRRARVLAPLAFISAMLALGGCSSAQFTVTTGPPLDSDGYTGPPVTLEYWNGFTGGDGPYMREMVEKFNESQDDITVVSNTLGWTDFYQRITAAVHAGQGPDVAAMQLDQLATQAARSTMVPMEDAIEEMGFTADDFPESLVEAGTFDGHLWGVPLDTHTLAQYANDEQLAAGGADEPPATGDELAASIAGMQEAGVEHPFWMPNRWPAHLMFLSLLWQFGGEPYSEDGTKATFNSPEGVQALTWMVDQVSQGASPSDVAIDSQYLAFKNGENSITWDGIWQINDLKDTAEDLPWSISPLPTVGPEPAAWANSHQLVIMAQRNPDDDRLQASKVFIQWMIENAADWGAAGMIPAYNPAREDPEFESQPQAVVAENVDTFHYLPAVPGLGNVQAQTLELAISDAILGRATPQEALDAQAQRADALLAGNAERFGTTDQE